jgi:hypothetical protein
MSAHNAVSQLQTCSISRLTTLWRCTFLLHAWLAVRPRGSQYSRWQAIREISV